MIAVTKTYRRNSSLNDSKLLFFFSWPLPFLADELSFFEALPLPDRDLYSDIRSDDLSSWRVCGLYNFPFSRLSSSAAMKIIN